MISFRKTRNLFALLMIITVLSLLCSVSVFADAGTTAGTTAADTSAADTSAADTSASDTTGTDTTGTDTTGADTTGADTTAADTTDAAGSDSDGGLSTGDIVGLVITGVIVIVLAVLGIRFRDKVAKFVRSLISEIKNKIVWSTWKDSRKNTIVVIVIVLILAAVIWLLDTAFWNGILRLGDAINLES